MIIFDGYLEAGKKEEELRLRMAHLSAQEAVPCIGAVLCVEDAGSRLYTRFKYEAAIRVGIGYVAHEFSLKTTSFIEIKEVIEQLNQDPKVTGIIIQKPRRSTWIAHTQQTGVDSQTQKSTYDAWWHSLTELINPAKDVDGLHPETLASVQKGIWRAENKVLPATCRAVLSIMNHCEMNEQLSVFDKKIIILGQSEILGLPLYYELKNLGAEVELLNKNSFEDRLKDGRKLLDAAVLVTATGRHNLINGDMLRENVVVIDAGEPKSDVELLSVQHKAAFLTPVPGGVGPMTVSSLLENAIDLQGISPQSKSGGK